MSRPYWTRAIAFGSRLVQAIENAGQELFVPPGSTLHDSLGFRPFQG